MKMLRSIKPKFWDHRDVAAGPYKHLFNFRRIWKMAVILTAAVSLGPLITITMIDYKVTQSSVESEALLTTSHLVSNTRRSVSFFLDERKSALDFIIRDNSFEVLNEPGRLGLILTELKNAFGGFVDLGVIDPLGRQRAYEGPYHLSGLDYSREEWFKKAVERGVYISDVFLGFRHEPHLVIAVKRQMPNGSFYLLRATLDTGRFNDLLSRLEMTGQGDALIINTQGILQTPSHNHGKVLEKITLPVPAYSEKTTVLESIEPGGKTLIVGYAYIAETPFILMIVREKTELMGPWYDTRIKLIGFLIASVAVNLFVILGVATYLVSRIFTADQKRVTMLHNVEYSNKMAAIGRLAAGVAHEINNPLAIINEKAGLIKDLFTIKETYRADQKLTGLVDAVISSVERCAAITRRLLSFSRHDDMAIKPLDLAEVIREVLSFLAKEAEHRSIVITVDAPDAESRIESERGRLQEIFLNIINNAFAALDDGGSLWITVRKKGHDSVFITITDNGCGIPKEDLKRVFEPFFSTKTNRGGTGLGLSITAGLVQDLGGRITVESAEGKGASFMITLPIQLKDRRKPEHESIAGR